MRLRALVLVPVLAGLVLWAGCGPKASPDPLGTRVVPTDSSDLVVVAIGDLARRLSVHASRVSVAKVEPVDWPDTSLGCPQPDMLYAQVITPGYRIVLSVASQTYEYHTDRVSQVVLCSPTSPKS
ncbi:MAG: hypothetical protein HYY01_13635 [Chloroflexi bacterium]|nr:hypothetical protein [Chloroflexota bacterium]